MLISLDIETTGLDYFKDQITCIGVWDGTKGEVFRGKNMLVDLQSYLNDSRDYTLVGQNFKFDLRFLAANGLDLSLDRWAHDTQMMAYVSTNKIPEGWLAMYENRRKEENKQLPKGYSHRAASLHSLKTLAPYFLDVEPFWEDPTNHDSDEYVIKDCKYTYDLFQYFKDNMSDEEWIFYKQYQLPWAKELLRAELKGVKLDLEQVKDKQAESEGEAVKYKLQVLNNWEYGIEVYKEKVLIELEDKYESMKRAALKKGKDPVKADEYYDNLKSKAALKAEETGALILNLDSPSQLMWLLGEYYQYDIVGEGGKLSTDKEVLERLAENHSDIDALLKYRMYTKLCSTYYPSYLEMQYEGRIHCSFNTNTTRTGRLSSSRPNLQNQPPVVRPLFVADPGYKFIVRDLSAIEPTLVAFYSKDVELMDVILNGGDFHGKTATVIFPYIDCELSEIKKKYPKERAVAKTAGLAILYGSGARRLQGILAKEGFLDYTVEHCRQIVNNIRKFYSGVWQFKKELDRRFSRGEIAYNYMGRPIQFSNPDDVYMKGFNRLIQGSASDIVQESIKRYNEYCRGQLIDSQVLITVHDEILVQAPNDHVEELQEVLEWAMTSYDLGEIKLRVEGGVSDRWEKF